SSAGAGARCPSAAPNTIAASTSSQARPRFQRRRRGVAESCGIGGTWRAWMAHHPAVAWKFRRNRLHAACPGAAPTPLRRRPGDASTPNGTIRMRLLVVEDNRNLVANIFEYFEARGHVLDAAPDGPNGLHLAGTQAYDAIVLDWMLPRLDGPEVLRRLRDAGSDVPVLMLTARDELPDKIAGFRAGADDYLTKPFALPELEVRLEALVHRATGHGRRRVLEVADLKLDL